MPTQERVVSRRVVGLCLAAGRSARMGHSNNKLTIPVDGRPLVAWAVDAMLGAGIDSPRVVTGFEFEAVQAALEGRACVFSHHADWESGMGSSLAFGVGESMSGRVGDEAAGDAMLICLGDLPGLRASTLKAVFSAVSAERMHQQIVIPTFQGRRGHPVLFGRAFWPALAELSGDEGAKAVVAAAGQGVVEVEVETDAIFADLDTPEDLAAWQARGE